MIENIDPFLKSDKRFLLHLKGINENKSIRYNNLKKDKCIDVNRKYACLNENEKKIIYFTAYNLTFSRENKNDKWLK